MLPAGFVYLDEVDTRIQSDIKYATPDNLLARPVLGYHDNRCIMTQACAQALSHIQDALVPKQQSLMIYEAYRPLQASEDILHWTLDATDKAAQADYYPNIDKAQFYALGFLALLSGHNRGSTIDLTIIDEHQHPLDMGTPFDFMDVRSYPDSRDVSSEAYKNRQTLRNLMRTHGFEGIETEWWHFTLIDEPFKTTYFDFPVA